MLIGAFLFGEVGFLAGVFGPAIFTPEDNLGPLLGILYTGLLGFDLAESEVSYIGAFRTEKKALHQKTVSVPLVCQGFTMRFSGFNWGQRTWIGLGVLEFLGAALWCAAGAGIYGSPLAGVGAKELLKIWAFLLVGPFSMLPAAILATIRPCWGGLWSVVAGLLSGYLILFVIPHPNLRGGLHFEAIVPLLLVSVPMFGVGVWQLAYGAVRVDP